MWQTPHSILLMQLRGLNSTTTNPVEAPLGPSRDKEGICRWALRRVAQNTEINEGEYSFILYSQWKRFRVC